MLRYLFEPHSTAFFSEDSMGALLAVVDASPSHIVSGVDKSSARSFSTLHYPSIR